MKLQRKQDRNAMKGSKSHEAISNIVGVAGNAISPESLYAAVKDVIDHARGMVARSVNTVMVQAYWTIGRLIVENEQKGARRAEYGKRVLLDLSRRLTLEYGKGFTITNIQYMRQFYLLFPNYHSVSGELSWTHYRRLMAVSDRDARDWYAAECVACNWSVRELNRQIVTQTYERVLNASAPPTVRRRRNLVAEESASVPSEILKDPYILEFLGVPADTRLHETALETMLISHLSAFLLELGRGFCFVARQKRLSYDDEDLFVDLVFYHSVLKCHVLIDLKVGRLTHKDVGQMDSYVRMFDAQYRRPDDNPTIGLLLCSEKRESVVKYSVLAEHRQVFASRYMLELPSEEVLKRQLSFERERINLQLEQDSKGSIEP